MICNVIFNNGNCIVGNKGIYLFATSKEFFMPHYRQQTAWHKPLRSSLHLRTAIQTKTHKQK